MNKSLLSLGICMLIFGCLTAQVTVTGVVTDEKELPLGVVTIILKGASIGTTTDFDGKYSLTLPSGKGILVFNLVGYNAKEIEFNGQTTLNVVMKESFTQLDEVLVVGYGVQKKSDITGAISSIGNKDFRDQPVANLAGSIQGKLAGINVTSPSGTPGAGLLVSIRGAQNPLYVVDGIPLLSESNSALSTSFDTDGNVIGQGQNISSVSDINPNEIESIEILKDASAAAIYGARAANGVVLITTKRGAQGKTQFNLNYYTGIQQLARNIPFMSSTEMVALIEDARQQDLKLYQNDPTVFGPDFNPELLTNPLPADEWKTGVNTNWLDEIFRSAPINNLELSARGGTEKTRFYISGGYFDQEGIVINSNYKRLNGRINLDQKVSDRFNIGTTLNLSHSINRRSFNDDTYTGIVTNAIGASPLMPAYDDNGNYTNFEDYQVSWLSDNPVKSANEIRAFTNSDRLMGSVFAEYKPFDFLKLKTVWSLDYTNLNDEQFFSPITADAQTVGGRALNATYRNQTWLGENTANFTKTFESGHHFDLLLGYTLQESKTRRNSISGEGFPLGSGLQNVGSAAVITGGTALGTSWGLLSYIGRVNYDYKSKYLLSASIRADGSSRFSKNNKYGYFPSLSLGWRITQESFAKSDLLTDLKLRFSYGLTGDQEIGDYQYISFWQPSRYNGQSGLRPRNIADPDLSWQANQMLNAGIDYEFWQGRLSGSLEYFSSTRSKLLSEDLVPGTTGFATITRNSGEIRNSGLEFAISAAVLNKSLKWTSSFNFTYLKNEVLKLSSDGQLLSAFNDLPPTHILKVGQPVGSFWGIKYLGVDPQTGDPMFEDINGDGIIDNDDSQIIGKAMPDFFGGWNNTLSYRNFDLNLITQFSIGNKVYNLIRPVYQNLGWSDEGWDENNVLHQIYANNAAYVKVRWEKPGDQSDIPRASLVIHNYIENSSMFVENASFFRFRTLSLGYTFRPQGRHWFENARLYVQVQNLYVITKYKGFDPEVSSNGGNIDRTAGVDYAAYPPARTWMLGVNIGF